MTMKKAVVLSVLLLLTLMLAACGKSAFGLTENTEKKMTLTAENAEKDAFFLTGSLEVGEGESIVITSDLSKGSIRVEILAVPESQSIDQLPETDGQAVITANLVRTDGASGTVAAGTYLLRAICLEKATGTATVEVKPAA